MVSVRGRPWWAVPAVVAVLAATLVMAGHAGASARRGIDEIFDPSGLVGVVPGQAVRLNVSNVSEGSCRAKLQLIDPQGAVVASKAATIDADASASLRLQPSGRIQVRARVISIMQSCSKNEVSIETIELKSGKTVTILEGEPIG